MQRPQVTTFVNNPTAAHNDVHVLSCECTPNMKQCIWCQGVVAAGGAFMFGYVVAGLLVLVVSFALVINADLHKKRGHKYAREAKQKD